MEPFIAASAITWTPVTFYVASGIINTIVILVAFRILQVDVEHNSFIGAAIAATVFTVIAYYFRDAGVIGAIFTGGAVFGMLVFVSSGEALKAVAVSLAIFGTYGLLGDFIVSRTPLTIDEIAGIPRVVVGGGLEAEPITEEDNDALNKATF